MSKASPGVNLVSYIREVVRELKKVSWPDRQTTINMTMLVVVVSLLTGLYLGGLDFIFTRVMTFILG